MKRVLKRMIRVLTTIVVLGVLSLVFLAYYADRQLAKKQFTDAYDNCKKVWSARGLYGNGIDQNSIESISKSFEAGAMGVEVDVFYDVTLKEYVVSHDRPYNLKGGKIFTLGELFDALGDGQQLFWLDFKKLRRLNRRQALEAVDRLTAITSENGLKQRVYIEGSNPTNLSRFKRAGFPTIFDIQPEPSDSILAPAMIGAYKIVFCFGDYTVLGMEYGTRDRPIYSDGTVQQLGHIPVFLYHVPVDERLIDGLLETGTVRALLVGNNQSVNLHHLDDCP